MFPTPEFVAFRRLPEFSSCNPPPIHAGLEPCLPITPDSDTPGCVWTCVMWGGKLTQSRSQPQPRTGSHYASSAHFQTKCQLSSSFNSARLVLSIKCVMADNPGTEQAAIAPATHTDNPSETTAVFQALSSASPEKPLTSPTDASSKAPAHEMSKRDVYLVFAMLMLAMFLASLDQMIVSGAILAVLCRLHKCRSGLPAIVAQLVDTT